MGVGILNAMVFHSGAPQTAAYFAGVLVFCGYLAYDTQKIRDAYHGRMTSSEAGAVAVWGAMDLYLDLLNLFFDLLRILGDADWGDAIGSVIGSAFDD